MITKPLPFKKLNLNETVGLLFDVDELLSSNRREIHQAYKVLMESLGVSVFPDEDFKGKDLFEILTRLKEKYGVTDPLETLVQKRRQIYLKIVENSSLQACVGVKELFNFFENQRNKLNVRIGYVTSSEKAMTDIVLAKLFEFIGMSYYVDKPNDFFYQNDGVLASTCWESPLKKKPSPQLYQLTMDKMNIQPQQCIAFEDSLSGCLAAIKAGANVVVIPSGDEQALVELIEKFENRVIRFNSLIDFVPYLNLLPQIAPMDQETLCNETR